MAKLAKTLKERDDQVFDLYTYLNAADIGVEDLNKQIGVLLGLHACTTVRKADFDIRAHKPQYDQCRHQAPPSPEWRVPAELLADWKGMITRCSLISVAMYCRTSNGGLRLSASRLLTHPIPITSCVRNSRAGTERGRPSEGRHR